MMLSEPRPVTFGCGTNKANTAEKGGACNASVIGGIFQSLKKAGHDDVVKGMAADIRESVAKVKEDRVEEQNAEVKFGSSFSFMA